MALITCPECGHMISDKSHACVSCGYPISESFKDINECMILGKKYILPNISETASRENYGVAFIEMTDYINKIDVDNRIRTKILWYIIEYYANHSCTPNIITNEDLSREISKEEFKNINISFKNACREVKENAVNKNKQTAQIRCPNCGSTNVKKISLTKRFFSTELFGLASSSIGKQFQCMEKNCGYKW